MKKFWLVLSLAMFCLIVGSLWEFSLNDWSADKKLFLFQERLKFEEKRLDDHLRKLDHEAERKKPEWKGKQSVLVGFKGSKLVYWSNERVGSPRLYEILSSGSDFVKINNLYFDVRKHAVGDTVYYALLFIKEDYPYSSNYVKSHFNPSLGENLDDASKVIIREAWEKGGQLVYNRDGRPLFKIESQVERGDVVPTYFLLIPYIMFLLLLFYAYEISLDRARSFRMQLFHVFGFFFLIVLLRSLMVDYKVPQVLYSLPIFTTSQIGGRLIVSVGDLFVTMFCLAHYFFITFNKLKIKYDEPRLVRYKYIFLVGFVIGVFFYTNLLHFSINTLIESTQVSLNIARLINVDFSSIVAFITLIIAGMGFIVLINSSVRYFQNLFSISQAFFGVTGVLVFCAALCYFFNFSLSPLECLFPLSLYLLFILGVYLMKQDAQKSIFMIALVVVCIYIIFLAKSSEIHREQGVRASFANEIIKERDPIFEYKLLEINNEIKQSQKVDSLVKLGDSDLLSACISNELLDMTGFYYACQAMICDPRDSILLTPTSEKYGCDEYYDKLIDSLGTRIGYTSFFYIKDFDGVVEYLGRFSFSTPRGGSCVYIRFESKNRHEGIGYAQILSREIGVEKEARYPYSYAKYKSGILVDSKGDFSYPRYLERFGKIEHARIMNMDGFSHMVIPVENDGVCIVSLGDDVFALYYLNLLYAIFVSAILTSYGMFFRFDGGWGSFRQTSLTLRIKKNIITLIGALFLIMTIMSIIVNAESFERRHSSKVIEVSRYITDELEHNDCVDAARCPQILKKLKDMSEVLWVDINIYNWDGALVATSRPVIFEKGFDGVLLNPKAFEQIVKKEQINFVQDEKIVELTYMAVYMPLVLENGERYVLSIPYFTRGEELNKDILLIVIIAVNIAMIVMVLAFILSSIVAERITKPLQVVNEKLRQMRVGGKNEKIVYHERDEIGMLVKEYNEMVDKLEANVKKLAKSERESAWREMARQIAHEIKNPLTPMKLNLQFMQRTLQKGDMEEVRQRFKDISAVLIEQIDHMASIASAFSDFAKLQEANNEWFDLSELVNSCAKLFYENVDVMECDIEPNVSVYGDRDQVNRVIVNLLKNAEQSIPEGREGHVLVRLKTVLGKIILLVKDNGCGIPESIRDRISEPNFTTKSGGTGLGLAMSYKIIEAMGGSITFESVENEGTTFYVVLKQDN